MSTDLDEQLARAYPSTGIRPPPAAELWQRGREHRRRRRAAGILGGAGVATLAVVIAATSGLTLPGTEPPTPVIANADQQTDATNRAGNTDEQEPASSAEDSTLAERYGLDARWTDEMILLLPEFDIDPRALADSVHPGENDELYAMVADELARRDWEPTRPPPINLDRLTETRPENGQDIMWYAIWGADSLAEHLGDDLAPFCDWIAAEVDAYDIGHDPEPSRTVWHILDVEIGQHGDGLAPTVAQGCGLQDPPPPRPTDGLYDGLDPTAHGWLPPVPPVDLDPLNVDEVPQWYLDSDGQAGLVGLDGIADRLGSTDDAQQLCTYLVEQQAEADAAVGGRAAPGLVVHHALQEHGAREVGDGLSAALGLACEMW